MRYEHEKSFVPVGHWDNIRIEGDKCLADPVFNEKHWLGAQLKDAYDGGHLNAASGFFRALEVSMEPEHLLPGQAEPTFVRSEIIEASLVEVPANALATRGHESAETPAPTRREPIALSARTSADLLSLRAAALSAGGRVEVTPTTTTVNKTRQPATPADAGKRIEQTKPVMNETQLAALCVALGLPAGSSPEDITSAATALRTSQIEGVIALGLTKGVITEANKAQFEALAANNLDAVRGIVDAAPEPTAEVKQAETPAPVAKPVDGAKLSQTLTDAKKLAAGAIAGQAADTDGERASWDYETWAKKDPKGLAKLKADDPNGFAAVCKRHGEKYGQS